MKRRNLGNTATAVLAVMLCGAFVTPALGRRPQRGPGAGLCRQPDLEAARAQLRATRRSGAGSAERLAPDAVVGTAQGGKTLDRTEHALLQDQNLESRTFGVTVSQPVFSGFETVSSTSAAENRVLSGRANLANSEQQVLLQAVQAYMQVVRDRAVLDLNRNNENVIGQQLQATRDRFDAGEVTRTDVAQAEVALCRVPSRSASRRKAISPRRWPSIGR